jgi:hypothetical protein
MLACARTAPPSRSLSPRGRQLAARQLEAARVLAGRPALRALAAQTRDELSAPGAHRQRERAMTSTHACDLAAVLGVPSEWLRDGWRSPATRA